jgi:hypothetical protein
LRRRSVWVIAALPSVSAVDECVIDVGDQEHLTDTRSVVHHDGSPAARFRVVGNMGRVADRRLIGVFALVLALSACGGSSGSSSGGSGSASGGGGGAKVPGLTAKVSDAKVQLEGSNYVTSAKITVGGVPGKKLTLEWGLVDALQGNESQDEIVLRRYVLTKQVTTDVQMVKIPVSRATSPLLVHYVLYNTDGAYLASDDTPDFGKGV